MTRRQFAQVTAGTVALGATTAVSAQQGPDYGGWFDGVANFDGTVDETGQDTVEITVGAQGNGGAFAFSPAAVRVSPGTEVVWTWTGEGGGHNVVSDGDGPLDSGGLVSEQGTTYSHTFESEGIYKYVCEPHKGLGMKGAVVVGAASGGSSGGGSTATATASGDSESSGGNATSGDGGRTGSASGPVTALAAVIAMAFFSPLAFAALMRRKAKQTDRRR
ncbi:MULTISPECIES: halocyanin domain-containing protein [Haloarcula]|nr:MULTISPECIES: halocyanin domain-containing protein [Halomicroarcula]MDS0276199.1 halocyanin domain-containing protein [Halomicroarcula sp. S1AR25-4]